MTDIADYMRRRVAMLIDSDIGSSGMGGNDLELGAIIFHYVGGGISLTIGDAGLEYIDSRTRLRRRYSDVAGLRLMPLIELVQLRGADAEARLVIYSGDEANMLVLPYKVYSTVATMLEHVVGVVQKRS